MTPQSCYFDALFLCPFSDAFYHLPAFSSFIFWDDGPSSVKSSLMQFCIQSFHLIQFSHLSWKAPPLQNFRILRCLSEWEYKGQGLI